MSAPNPKNVAPKKSGGLTYPSPLLAVPSPTTASRSIEIVFDGRAKTRRATLASKREKLQIEAAGKIGAMSKTDKSMRERVAKAYRESVERAEGEYQLDLRAAQRKRDQRLGAAKTEREENLALAAREFSAATEPVERDLKSSIYMLDTAAEEELTAEAEEFRIYHAAAVEMETAREAERKAKAAAEPKPGTNPMTVAVEASTEAAKSVENVPEVLVMGGAMAPNARKRAQKKTATAAV